jgi:hypothetical protein
MFLAVQHRLSAEIGDTQSETLFMTVVKINVLRSPSLTRMLLAGEGGSELDTKEIYGPNKSGRCRSA